MLDGDLSDASQCMVSTLDDVASGASVYPSLMNLFNDDDDDNTSCICNILRNNVPDPGMFH